MKQALIFMSLLILAITMSACGNGGSNSNGENNNGGGNGNGENSNGGGNGNGDHRERHIPEGFGYIHEVIPDAKYDIRYYTDDNFVGTRVDGYLAPVAILTDEALLALKNVADELRGQGYGIIVFDAYRPQKAVDHFVRWARDPADTLTKQKYYPEVDKADLFVKGYIAERSGHTRGSTIDLSLYDLETGEEVDMGSGFDLFGPPSHHDSDLVTPEQAASRILLKETMERHGFLPYSREWWHYRLENEPYPDTFFDFDVQ